MLFADCREPHELLDDTETAEAVVKMECDDADSVNSDKTDEHSNTCVEESMPNIVSPPESPVLSSSIVKMPELLPDCIMDFSKETKSMPHTGDEVFFEGLKFRYLDHLDLDDVHQEINVTNVEYL